MDPKQRRTLRLLIEEHFNEPELRTLAYDLGIEYDDLGGRGRADNIRELIDRCRRRLLLPELNELLRQERPKVSWPGESGRSRLPMLFADSDHLGASEELFGRESLLREVTDLLIENERVLLVGLDGSGKTAVAQTVARWWIDEGRGRVLWMKSGQDSSDTIIEQMIARFATPSEKLELGNLAGKPRFRLGLRRLATRFLPLLLILDDVWNGQAIDDIVAALPKECALLVTSPERFRRFRAVYVDPLQPQAALELLGQAAGEREYQGDDDALKLAETLGYHAYALEIAGSQLAVDDEASPGQLLEQIESAPHNVEMPGVGRAIRDLLEHSYASLTPGLQQLLITFGKFPKPGATSTLISNYLDSPKLAVDRDLRELARRSLLKRQGSHLYEIPRLCYSFARELAQSEALEGERFVGAVHRYISDQAGNNELLALDQDNIFAAVQQARATDVVVMIDIIFRLSIGGYFDAAGHTPESLSLLDEAIAIVECRESHDEETNEVLHWLFSKRGNEYVDRGDIDNGLACYQKALDLAPDDFRKAVGLSAIGRVLAEHDSAAGAEDYLKQALQVADSTGDDRALSFVLHQQSVAARALGDDETALHAAREAVRLQAPFEAESPAVFGQLLLDRASIDIEIAQKRVLREHQRVLAIAEEARHLNLLADAYYAVGLDYHGMYENREMARRHLLEARRLFRHVGAIVLESEVDKIIRQYGYDTSD